MNSKVIQGNNIDTLKQYPDNHFDAIVTDPPYGIEFLAKEWDKNTGAVETWAECFRVLKPGGYLLAFSAARTYHNLATNIEGVGFEIRDQLMWLYASGFPKAQDIGKAIQRRQGVEKYQTEKGTNAYPHTTKNQKMVVGSVTADDYKKEKTHPVPTSPEAKQWEGWKTALKPAHEPIVMARKPFKGSTIDNVLTHGVGALNIDATRVPYVDQKDMEGAGLNWNKTGYETGGPRFIGSGEENKPMAKPEEKGTGAGTRIDTQGRFPSNVLGEVEGYQKFFYCPKVSRAERHCGFEAPPDPLANYSQGDVKNHPLWDPSIGTNLQRLKHKILEHNKDLGKKSLDHIPTNPEGIYDIDKGNYIGSKRQQANSAGNNHPTVKPVALMKYLVTLVTPPGGKILDPFCGSGSTGMAAVELDYDFTGCELDPDYVNIAETRITAWKNKTDLENNPLPEEWFDE
jgi:DNA modification methylase